MKKRILLTALLTCLCGCAGLNEAFVYQVDANVQVIVPHYLEYVGADGTITDLEKRAIRAQCETFLDLMEAAKRNVME